MDETKRVSPLADALPRGRKRQRGQQPARPPTPFPALRLAQDELAALRDMTEMLIAFPPRTRARMLMWLSAFFREPMPSNDEDENKEDQR